MGAPEVWKRVEEDLRSKVTAHDYDCYISGLRFIAEVEGEVLIATKTPWAFQRVGANHKHLIQRVWKAHDEKRRRVRLACWETDRNEWEDLVKYPWADEAAPETEVEEAATAPQKALAETGEADTGITDDRAHLTFATLVEGPSNGSAARLLRYLANGGDVPNKILFVSGKQGTGKTHLLSACQHAILKNGRQRKVVYMTAEVFSAAFVEGAMAGDTRALKSRVRGGDILLVEDLQTIAKRPKTEEEFLNSIRAVKASGGTVVITADTTINEMAGLSQRLRHELHGATTAEIAMPDDAMRREIVRRHADLLQAKTPTFTFTEDMVKHLCLRVRGPGRELIGVLCSLYADVSIVVDTPTEPTLAHLDTVIRRQLGEQKPPTLEIVKRATTRLFGVSKAELESPTKVHSVVRPRQMAMYLCRTMTTKSFPQIGNAFGGRDHATVIYAVRKVKRLMDEDAEFADQVEQLRSAVFDVQAEH